MGFEQALTLYEKAGIWGLVVVLAVIFTGYTFRNKALLNVSDKDKIVDTGQLDAIDKKLSTIEGRLGTVENDVSNRATREEVHRLELSFTRMEGRFDSLSATTQATANAISRIEEFMYAAALRSKGEK